MKDVAGHGRTILFVSHNMTAVQSLCSRCVVMQHGWVDFSGGTLEAVQKYLAKSGATSHERVWESWDEAPGSDVLKIKSIRAVSLRMDGQDCSLFDFKTPINVEIECRVFQKSQVHVTLHFLTEQEEVAFTSGCVKVVHMESDSISIDVKDLTPRAIGSYHGKEPGPVRPLLNWTFRKTP